MSVSRKNFLAANAAAGAVAFLAIEVPHAAAAASASAPHLPLAFDPKDPALIYDLIVTGATVLDPSQARAPNGRLAIVRFL